MKKDTHCCDTHWKWALRSNQSSLGLLPYIHRYTEVQTFVRKMWALSYVPKDKIVWVWEEFIRPVIPVYAGPTNDKEDMFDPLDQNNCNSTLESWVLYCERTWIGAMVIKTKNRGKPKFKYDLWNKYEEVKLGITDLTNNHSETYNCAQKLTLQNKPDYEG